MIPYHPARMGQQAAPASAPSTETGIPKWIKIGLGGALIGAAAYGGLSQGRPGSIRKNDPEMAAIVGSFIGGTYILLQGLGIKL